jgi:cytochrome c-type biogenesis protein
MTGTDLSFAVAVGAGLISFLSPCVLPLVPAYLGQLTAVAVANADSSVATSRWLALRHSAAYVLGFGLVFTLLGVTATLVAGGLSDFLPALRQVGGIVLIVLGLSLAGIVRIPILERSWRPLDAGAAAEVASRTGTLSLAPAGVAGSNGGGTGSTGAGGAAAMVGRRLVGAGGLGSSFGLGAIFAIGWTPCIGVILGGILMLAATSAGKAQGALLLVGYTAGLGIPFILIAAFYDRSRRLTSALVRHGRIVSLVGGLLVVAIGIAMMFDWLVLLPRYFQFVPAL